jgi:hypothetical protein
VTTSRDAWVAEANALLEVYRALLAPLGATVASALVVKADAHPCPGYLHDELIICFCPPVVEGPSDRVRWAFFTGYMGCASLDEAAAFYRDALPLVVAHELAHHLRISSGRAAESPFIEEQICDLIAVALVAASDRRASLRPLPGRCAVMRSRLDLRYAASPGAGFVFDEAELLVERGDLGAGEVLELEEAARRGDVPLDALIGLSMRNYPAPLRAAGAARARARQHVEAHYSSDPAAYWHLSLRWLEGYLGRGRQVGLVEALNEHLAPRARSLDVVSSLLEVLTAGVDPPLRQAAALALLESLGPEIVHDLADLCEQSPEVGEPACRAVLHHAARAAHAVPRAALLRLARASLAAPVAPGNMESTTLALRVAAAARPSPGELEPLLALASLRGACLSEAEGDARAAGALGRELAVARAAMAGSPVAPGGGAVSAGEAEAWLEALLAWAPPGGAVEAAIERLVEADGAPLGRAAGLALSLAVCQGRSSPWLCSLAAARLSSAGPQTTAEAAAPAVSLLQRAGGALLLDALPRRGLPAWGPALDARARAPRGGHAPGEAGDLATPETAPRGISRAARALRRAAALAELGARDRRVDGEAVEAALRLGEALLALALIFDGQGAPWASEGARAARLEARALFFELVCSLSDQADAAPLARLADAHRAGSAPPRSVIAAALGSLGPPAARAPADAADAADAADGQRRAASSGVELGERLAALAAGGAPLRAPRATGGAASIAELARGAASPVVALVASAVAPGYGGLAVLSLVERLVLLRSAPLFEHVGPEALLALAALSAEVRFPEGTTLFVEGQPGDVMYLMLRGSVRVWGGEGASARTLAVLEPPACLGEVAVLDGGPRTASAEAASDCVLLAVEGAAVRRVGHQEPALYEALLRVLSARLRVTRTQGRASLAEPPRRDPPGDERTER